jgi:hypothetical protein
VGAPGIRWLEDSRRVATIEFALTSLLAREDVIQMQLLVQITMAATLMLCPGAIQVSPLPFSSVATQTSKAKASAPLAKMAEIVLHEGEQSYMQGYVSSVLLGLTANEEQWRCKIKTIVLKNETKLIGVSKRGSEIDIVIGSHTVAGRTLYRTSPTGTLIKACIKTEDWEEIPLQKAQKGFEKEKKYWLKKLGRPKSEGAERKGRY